MLVDDIDTLRTRFRAQWGNTAPVVFDNAPNVSQDVTQPYVRFVVRPGVQRRDSFGTGSRHSQLGRVVLTAYVPKQAGAKGAYELADTFSAIFRNWRSADYTLTCTTPEVSTLDGAEWFEVQVSVPWESVSYL